MQPTWIHTVCNYPTYLSISYYQSVVGRILNIIKFGNRYNIPFAVQEIKAIFI